MELDDYESDRQLNTTDSDCESEEENQLDYYSDPEELLDKEIEVVSDIYKQRNDFIERVQDFITPDDLNLTEMTEEIKKPLYVPIVDYKNEIESIKIHTNIVQDGMFSLLESITAVCPSSLEFRIDYRELKPLVRSKTIFKGNYVHQYQNFYFGKVAKCFDLYVLFPYAKKTEKIETLIHHFTEKLMFKAFDELEEPTASRYPHLNGGNLRDLLNFYSDRPMWPSCEELLGSLSKGVEELEGSKRYKKYTPYFYAIWPGAKQELISASDGDKLDRFIAMHFDLSKCHKFEVDMRLMLSAVNDHWASKTKRYSVMWNCPALIPLLRGETTFWNDVFNDFGFDLEEGCSDLKISPYSATEQTKLYFTSTFQDCTQRYWKESVLTSALAYDDSSKLWRNKKLFKNCFEYITTLEPTSLLNSRRKEFRENSLYSRIASLEEWRLHYKMAKKALQIMRASSNCAALEFKVPIRCRISPHFRR